LTSPAGSQTLRRSPLRHKQASLLDADPRYPEIEQRIVDTAGAQLRLIALGRRHWLDDRPTSA
jgi:hypothetical protein